VRTGTGYCEGPGSGYLPGMSTRGILPGHGYPGHNEDRPNPFAGGALDRAADRRSDPGWVAACLSHPDARVVPVWSARSLVALGEGEPDGFRPVLLGVDAAREVADPEAEWVLLGLDEGRPVFAAEVVGAAGGDPPLAALGEFHDLHRIGATLGQREGSLLAYARAVTTWSRAHRFCGRCGHPTRPVEGGHVRRCENEACESEHFPRTDPAIIVLVEDDERCLLGRKSIWPEGVYSVLAGFVEPGESLSEAVAREVYEEAGIEVGHVRYRSSQPWPFPSSLMLGFRAVRTGGDLRVDPRELEDARWFRRDEIVNKREAGLRLPTRVSIARRLIEEWVAGEG